MDTNFTLPPKITNALLEDAKQRDVVTARRAVLLEILWGERFLTREHLVERVEMRIGIDCFGEKSWQETFYRDMRFVKQAFAQAGYTLKYSRSAEATGYHFENAAPLNPDIRQEIQGALKELDIQQLAVIGRLPPAQKFFQAVSMIDLGRRVSAQTRK